MKERDFCLWNSWVLVWWIVAIACVNLLARVIFFYIIGQGRFFPVCIIFFTIHVSSINTIKP